MRTAKHHHALLTGAIVVGGALLATGCSAPGESDSSSSGSDTGPVQLAIVDAQSGQLSSLGHWEANGVTLAVNQINDDGGICGGRKIELTQFDDQGDPTTGTTLAQKIATDDYAAVMGTAESGVTLAMIPILSQASIPMITSGQSPKLEQTGSEFLFMNSPTSTTFDSTLAQYLVETKGLKSVAMITNNGAYGTGEHDAFLAALEELGLTPVADEVVTPDQKDFTGALTSVRGANPDVIFIGAEEVEAGLIAKQARTLGIQAPIAGGAPIGTQVYIDTAGVENAEGSMVSTPYLSNDVSDETKAFAAAYDEEFGEEAEAHGAKAYDGATIVAQALDSIDCATGKELADAIRASDYTGLQGEFSFDENGVGLQETHIGVITDGKVVAADD